MTEDPPALGMAPHEPTLQEIAHEGALDHVLSAISWSKWGGHLVLRGSALLRAWYGQDARRPHDLDFVVDSDLWEDDERLTASIFEELFDTIDLMPRTELMEGLRFVPSRVVRSRIYAYGDDYSLVRDRVDDRFGYRLTLPWHCGDASGTVQVDFAFDEKLHVPPIRTAVPRPSGEAPLFVKAATPEQSLCWKLRWLWTESQLKSKDLYDAWLLRAVRPSAKLLAADDDFADAGLLVGTVWLEGDRIEDGFDWDAFRADHPMVRGSARDYIRAVLRELMWPVFYPEEPPPEWPE
jgi:hypothetical protein